MPGGREEVQIHAIVNDSFYSVQTATLSLQKEAQITGNIKSQTPIARKKKKKERNEKKV